MHEKEDEKAKSKHAADLLRLGQAQFRKAQASQGDDAVAAYEECAKTIGEAIAAKPSEAKCFALRGRCFLALQQYQRALSDFSMAIRFESTVAKHFGLRGLCFKRLGRVEEALRDYEDAIGKCGRDDKDLANLLFERALVHIDLEQYDKAIEGFDTALEKKLQTPYKAHFHRGICYRKVGKLDDSIENLKAAIGLDPNSAEAHNHLGLSYVQIRNYHEAKKCFSSAIEHDHCARYLNNRGLASYHVDEFESAIDDYTAALQETPNDSEVHFNRGNARVELKQYESALSDFEAAIQFDPDNATYIHHKGLAFQGCGIIHEAISCYEEALRHDPEHHPSRYHLGIMYHLDGQYGRALDAFNGGIPVDAALHKSRGLVYRDMGDYQRALADFNAVIQLEPSNAAHYYDRGVVYHRMAGHAKEPTALRELGELAIEDLTKALELGSTDAAVHSERGLAWRALRNMAQAVIDLTAAIDADPQNTLFLSNRAQCLFEQGLYDRAEADLSRALALDFKDPQLLYKRGITRYAQRRYADAIADLKAALDNEPFPGHLADIFYHLGVSYANLGKHALAVSAYDQAVRRSTGASKPHYFHERAKSLQVVGEHERALTDFKRVIDMQPTNARALFRRAFSLKARGMYEEAAEDFEAAKEFAPDDPRLVINYRKVYSVACISLGPAGHEDPNPTGEQPSASLLGAAMGLSRYSPMN